MYHGRTGEDLALGILVPLIRANLICYMNSPSISIQNFKCKYLLTQKFYFQELILEGILAGIPILKVYLHIYTDSSTRRFVAALSKTETTSLSINRGLVK